MSSSKSTENPTLAVAFGRVLRDQRHRFAQENDIMQRESLEAVAGRCAMNSKSLQGMEGGSNHVSRDSLIKLMRSGVYRFSGTRLSLINDVIITIRKYSIETAKEIFKDSAELLEIIELSEQVTGKNCRTTFRENIDRKGLFSKVHEYLLDDPYRPRPRHHCYCEFASEEDLPLLQKNQPVANYYSLDDYKKRWERNPQIFSVVYKNCLKRQYIGQFRMAPLTDTATAELLKPMPPPPKFPINYFSESFSTCTSVEIGVGGIKSTFNRGVLMMELLSQIEELLSFQNISIFFAHPLHLEGKHLADKFEFDEIPKSDLRFLTVTHRRLKNFGLQPVAARYN